jgi:hypothetical protein
MGMGMGMLPGMGMGLPPGAQSVRQSVQALIEEGGNAASLFQLTPLTPDNEEYQQVR